MPGADTASDRLASSIALALPSYDIGEQLGRGAFGVVVAGTHRRLGRPVAIKVVAPDLADNPDMQARFVEEARVLALLDHAHIVRIHDYVEHDGLCLLVMEKLAGGTLWQRFKDVGLTIPASCAAAIVTCAALQHAHDRKVLHRDVKPANLLVTEDNVIRVIDFGIASVIGGRYSHTPRTGNLIGTPGYMSPEQAQSLPLTPATDVYSAGIMLYEFLSGHLPFPDEGGALAVVFRHVSEEPVPLLLAAPDVPGRIAEVVMRGIACDPGDRFPTAEDFALALGDAASASWGSDWLGGTDFPLLAPGRLWAAAVPSRTVGPDHRVHPVVDQHVDGRIAVAIHDAYLRSKAGQADDPSARSWDDLDESLRVSSQAHADDIFDKLRRIDCTVHPVYGSIELLQFSATELEILAEMEHRRWNDERLAAGWTLGNNRDVPKKTTPYLVEWDELPEDIKDYDRQLISDLPNVLAAVGLEIRRQH